MWSAPARALPCAPLHLVRADNFAKRLLRAGKYGSELGKIHGATTAEADDELCLCRFCRSEHFVEIGNIRLGRYIGEDRNLTLQLQHIDACGG